MGIRWDERDMPALDGKVALVTGANAGLGRATATALAARGATVLLACRNPERAEATAREVRAVATGDVEVVVLDLARLASVAEAAEVVRRRHDRLDVLINNAGLMAVDRSRTEDGFETQFGVNHLGHFALTAGLMPLLLATPGSRVVTVSSIVHRLIRIDLDDLGFDRRGYDRWRPYYQSKLANLLFTAELHRRLTEARAGTAALAAHPGGTRTELGHQGTGLTNKVFRPDVPLMQSPRQGALPTLRAATDPEARGGQFYGPRFLLRGWPVVETPSRAARNAADARRLWERSEALTNLTIAIPTR